MSNDSHRPPDPASPDAHAEPVLAPPSREAVLRRLIEERQMLQRGLDAAVSAIGTVHRTLASALSASHRGLVAGDSSWLELRERLSLQSLTRVPPERASRIRFLSHQWSNQLHALSEMTHDEDLAQLAEDFYIDSRIMLATDGRHDATVAAAGAGGSDATISSEHLLGRLLFDCYRAGAWPCGWEGIFPQGRLQIFVR